MKTFILRRDEDETGISGTGVVAEGVAFLDGTIAMRWLTKQSSTAVYTDMKAVEAIHGHDGRTVVVWTNDVWHAAFRRGWDVCLQDSYENCPFSSAGGLEARPHLRAPDYIGPAEVDAYLGGYKAFAKILYGKDWATCEFNWVAAMAIGGEDS